MLKNIFYSSVLIAVTRLTTDQCGAARPVGPRCDVGAFEYSPPRYLYLPLIVCQVAGQARIITPSHKSQEALAHPGGSHAEPGRG